MQYTIEMFKVTIFLSDAVQLVYIPNKLGGAWGKKQKQNKINISIKKKKAFSHWLRRNKCLLPRAFFLS